MSTVTDKGDGTLEAEVTEGSQTTEFTNTYSDRIISFPNNVLAAQTIVNINERLREYADAHNIVYVDYHSALADEHGGFPAKLSADGCHPTPDTYFIMEELVLKAIGEALE